MGIKSIETFVDYTIIEKVEIVKRPGQTLGFYIREGNGIDRTDGVFISRIAAGSAVEKNGLLRVGEEILAIDSVDVTNMSLDDVVILMSIPSRLLLTIRTRRSCCKNLSCPILPMGEAEDEEKTVKVYRSRGQMAPTSVDELTQSSPFGDDYLRTGLRRLRPKMDADPTEETAPMSRELRYSARRRYRPDDTFLWEAVRHRPVERYTEPAETVVKRPFSGFFAELEAARRPISGRAATYETAGSWDRRTTAVSPYYTRRQVPYHPDYSSDTDAQFLQMEPPPREWHRVEVHPIPRKKEAETAPAAEYLEMTEFGRSRSKKKERPGVRVPLERDSSVKRYSSDSEVVTESSLLMGRQEAAYSTAGLLKPGDKCNSLPEIENGNGDSKDELKHWLRKLDKLSFELQDFNHRIATPTRKPCTGLCVLYTDDTNRKNGETESGGVER